MGKISIIYRDPEQAALRVEFHGVEFFHNVPTPIPDDDDHRELIAICEAHPHFTVRRKTVEETAEAAALPEDDDDEAQTKSSHLKRQEKARHSGAAAYHAGHAREPPPIRFREAWLEGFDQEAARLSEVTDGQSSHPVS